MITLIKDAVPFSCMEGGYSATGGEYEGWKSPEQETGDIEEFLRERPVDQYLTILSSATLVDPRPGMQIFRRVKEHAPELGAVALELDKNLQPAITNLAKLRRMASYSEFPGFGYTMSFCAAHNIPVHAVDAYQQQYFRRIDEIQSKLRNAMVHGRTEDFDYTFSEWQAYFARTEGARAEKTAEELKRVLKSTDKHVLHIASESQAQILAEML